MKDFSQDIRDYFTNLKAVIDSIDTAQINALMDILIEARDNNRLVFTMGNGGSASTASHYAGDFNKGLSWHKDKRFKFICLNDNIPTMMAYANDSSYDDIFIGPLKNFLNRNDVVIAISGSGNSRNIVKAIEWANKSEAVTVGLTGYDGGHLAKIAKYNVRINVNDMQIAEDLHLVLNHCMMHVFDKYLA
jgi:D-sedoheptulose 7-phosphate isomerase